MSFGRNAFGGNVLWTQYPAGAMASPAKPSDSIPCGCNVLRTQYPSGAMASPAMASAQWLRQQYTAGAMSFGRNTLRVQWLRQQYPAGAMPAAQCLRLNGFASKTLRVQCPLDAIPCGCNAFGAMSFGRNGFASNAFGSMASPAMSFGCNCFASNVKSAEVQEVFVRIMQKL
jgi:hypothetical protein